MHRCFCRVLYLAAAVTTLSAAAITEYVSDVQSYIVTAGSPNDLFYATPRSAGYDGVGDLLLRTPAGLGRCTGSVLSGGRDVLTAAHCVTDDLGKIDFLSGTATFSPDPTGTDQIDIESVSVHPDWNGNLFAGCDLAILHLSRPVIPGVQIYEIYTGGSELGAIYEVVGFGRYGTGTTGATGASGTRRRGQNQFEATLAQVLSGTSAGVLLSDFDDGTSGHDGFGYFFGWNNTGLGLAEVSTAPGDSGGPVFVEGKIAGVTSFGMRLRTTTGASPDIDGILNYSYGEFNGFTRVADYEDWITGHLVPEPGTYLLSVFGLLGIGVLRRRHRSM